MNLGSKTVLKSIPNSKVEYTRTTNRLYCVKYLLYTVTHKVTFFYSIQLLPPPPIYS